MRTSVEVVGELEGDAVRDGDKELVVRGFPEK